MTLILTAMTRRTVVQVADMRLTNMITGAIVDEASAKMIVYEGRFLFSYTGPSCMGHQTTAAWLASVLAAVADPRRLIHDVATEAQRIVRTYPRRVRRLAIVGAGWIGPAHDRRPVYLQAANFSFVDGDLFAEMRTSGCDLLRQDRARLFAAGVGLPNAMGAEAEGYIQRRSGRRSEDPGDVVAVMVRAARAVSGRHPDGPVGRRLLVGSIPNATDPIGFAPGMAMRLGPPDWSQPEFRYLGDGSETEPLIYTPGVAGRGIAMTDGYINPGGDFKGAPPNACR